MESNVELQNLFTYSLGYVVVFALILVAFIVIYILLCRKEFIDDHAPIEVNKPEKAVDANKIKEKYISKLNDLESRLNQNTVSNREAYQELSSVIRNFVFELTGINVQNYTLKEINAVNIPALSFLVEEYYSPEFSYEGNGNALESLYKTKEAIEGWN
jgi:hypothetical protein